MTEPTHIVLAEDDADIRAVLELSLAVLDETTCSIMESGDEALRLCADRMPDIAVFDVMMPGLSGPEAVARLRQMPGGNAVTVILLTAKVETSQLEELLDASVDGVIAKPFDPIDLPEQLLTYWRMKQSLASANVTTGADDD